MHKKVRENAPNKDGNPQSESPIFKYFSIHVGFVRPLWQRISSEKAETFRQTLATTNTGAPAEFVSLQTAPSTTLGQELRAR